MSEASPQWKGGWKLRIAAHPCMWYIYIYVSVCVYVPYAHNLESTRKILRTRLKKIINKIIDRLGKQAMEVTRLVNDKENDCRFEF